MYLGRCMHKNICQEYFVQEVVKHAFEFVSIKDGNRVGRAWVGGQR